MKRTLTLTDRGMLLLTRPHHPAEELSLHDLLGKSYVGQPEAVQPILEYLCKQLPLPDTADLLVRLRYQFYRHLNGVLVPHRRYPWTAAIEGNHTEYVSELTASGFIVWEHMRDGSLRKDHQQMLGDLLVLGPCRPGMPQDIRNELRQVLCAVAPGSGLTLKDTFPLLAYDKIAAERFDFSQTPDSGKFLYCGTGWVCIGGWSEPHHQGGAQCYSPEQVLRDPHFFEFLSVPEDLQVRVKDILANAILP
ncbi:MAG: hypothetical protein KF690_03090 [Bacteroidetes bacterium]|nr:hypothetical protein [Bacteroidota bacterium]